MKNDRYYTPKKKPFRVIHTRCSDGTTCIAEYAGHTPRSVAWDYGHFMGFIGAKDMFIVLRQHKLSPSVYGVAKERADGSLNYKGYFTVIPIRRRGR